MATSASAPASRIWVVGPPGSGKSTVAERLAARLATTATHLDDLHWCPGWVERPDDEMRRAVEAVVSTDAWVVDGNYAFLQDRFLPRADLVVWLDLPLSVTLPRLLVRCLARAWRRTPCCNGNRESLRMTFASRESLLLFAVATDRSRRRRYGKILAGRPHARLATQRSIDRWMAAGPSGGR